MAAKERYDHESIEQAAREKWDALRLYQCDLTDDTKKPYYLLFEFPYPSGDLHIGHWYAYAMPDIYARIRRMQGDNVFFPVGFDSFGLPAENAAMKNGADPKAWTYANIEKMTSQLHSMGLSADWSKKVITSDPSYYEWTQWLFAKLFEHEIAYRHEAPVKWCPKDQTVLANEQVENGACERCGTEVEEKKLTQWFMRISAFAERLLKDLEKLSWPEEIKEAQRAWIGKSEGALLRFALQTAGDNTHEIEVFTTRPDTIYGATYVVLAPEHPLVALLPLDNREEVQEYVVSASRKTERERSENKEKTGVLMKGVQAINPATREEIPVYVADYVLASYGTGAVMAVPSHDERDYAFSKKHHLQGIRVVEGEGECYTGDGALLSSDSFNGRNNREAMWEIVDSTGGERTTNYRIRDWLVSRQRYWGCPLPIVYDPEGKPHFVGSENLPWLLPDDVDFTPTGKPPLASSKELHERVERLFGKGWTPEYDTLDTFVDSSWYFLRYLHPHDENNFSDETLMKKWLPVHRYSGGSEHTTMHLLYSRFFTKALYDLSLVPVDEPFTERFNRGLIMGPDGQKMSKRWGNVVNPDEMTVRFGADAVRGYLAFIGPYNEPGHYPWKLDGVEAMRRFLERSYSLAERVREVESDEQSMKVMARTIEKVTTDAERFKFNTCISALMILLNELEKLPEVSRTIYRDYLRLLAPFAPHLTEHLWEKIGEEGSVHAATWPTFDRSLLTESQTQVVVQVQGKKKASLTLPLHVDEDEAKRRALLLPEIEKALQGVTVSKVIYVPGRIINIVTD